MHGILGRKRFRLREIPVSLSSLKRACCAVALLATALAGPSLAQGQHPGGTQPPLNGPGALPPDFGRTEAPFSIWDVKIGQPVSEIPDADIVNVACGTDGGPPSTPLKNFSEFAKCPAEPSGLHEVHFEYDDEQTYIAKAYNMEDRYLQGGTAVYAHPVIVSVLVDDQGVARGIRIITDDHASVRDRRQAASLEANLRGRFNAWGLSCQAIPPADGQESVGNTFVNDQCSGKDPQGDESLVFHSRYFRLKGQTALDPVTQKVVRDNFLSDTRFELVQAPFQPSAG